MSDAERQPGFVTAVVRPLDLVGTRDQQPKGVRIEQRRPYPVAVRRNLDRSPPIQRTTHYAVLLRRFAGPLGLGEDGAFTF